MLNSTVLNDNYGPNNDGLNIYQSPLEQTNTSQEKGRLVAYSSQVKSIEN